MAPLAAVAGGILVSRLVPLETRELLPALAAFLILTLFSQWRRNRPLAATCCLAALVGAGALTDVVHRPGPAPELDAEDRETLIVTGCVLEPPAIAGDRERFVVELEPGARMQVTRYLNEGESPPPLRYGQRVEFEARVRRPRNFRNPGAFDYAHYLARKEIFWTASARAGTPVAVLPGTCGSSFMRAVMGLRVAALQRLERLYQGNSYETGMMQAILIGETAQLQKVWTEDFRSTGTFHALVISGTHVAVLAAFFSVSVAGLLRAAGGGHLADRSAAWLYALVTGWHAPCVRSAAGLTLFMIGGYFYRERRLLNLLAAVAMGFLVCDPEQMFEASFQLSFLAVAFIGAFAVPLLEGASAPLARGLAGLGDTGRDLHLEPRAAQFRVEMRLLAETLRLWLKMPRRAALLGISVPLRVAFYIYELIVVSAVVQIGLALPMVVYFHRVGFSGLSANAFVVPLIGWWFRWGLSPYLPGWGWVAAIAAMLLDWSRAVVGWHARMEPNWRIPTPPLWVALGFRRPCSR